MLENITWFDLLLLVGVAGTVLFVVASGRRQRAVLLPPASNPSGLPNWPGVPAESISEFQRQMRDGRDAAKAMQDDPAFGFLPAPVQDLIRSFARDEPAQAAMLTAESLVRLKQTGLGTYIDTLADTWLRAADAHSPDELAKQLNSLPHIYASFVEKPAPPKVSVQLQHHDSDGQKLVRTDEQPPKPA